jgi:hypothetical protein
MNTYINQQYSVEKIEPSVSCGRIGVPGLDRGPNLSYLSAILFFYKQKDDERLHDIEKRTFLPS